MTWRCMFEGCEVTAESFDGDKGRVQDADGRWTKIVLHRYTPRGVRAGLLCDVHRLQVWQSQPGLGMAIFDPCTSFLEDSFEKIKEGQSAADRAYHRRKREERAALEGELKGVRP